MFHDDQFDDARLALALARTAASLGAVVANYTRVDALLRRDGHVAGVAVTDVETGRTFELPARVVVNATGVFVDSIRRLDDPAATPLVRASRGAHIVLAAPRFPGTSAVLLPHTDDGRVLFLIPWRGRVLVGTTDTATDAIDADVHATPDDVAYLIDHASRYLESPVTRDDVRSMFAGLRPLVAGTGPTASLRRDHRVVVSAAGLVSVTGGKWTTYRRMAEDAVDAACHSGGLDAPPSRTASQQLEIDAGAGDLDPIETAVCASSQDAPVADMDAVRAFVRRAAQIDMARHVEDVLARRSRALFLDARGSGALAEFVAGELARVLGRDDAWARAEADAFRRTVARHLPADADR